MPAALAAVSLMSRARKRTARPATFPLDPRTAPPRIWRLLSDHTWLAPHTVAAWHLVELLFGGPGRVETPRPGPEKRVGRLEQTETS